MARASGQKDYIAMSKGLITEASPLAFPEGATSLELNFTVNKNGLFRERRKGFERVYQNSSLFPGNGSLLENMYYWRGSGYVIAIITNDTPETFVRIHSMDSEFRDVFDVKISDSKVSTQIAELTDYLVITLSNKEKPIILEYDEGDNEIRVSKVDLYVRDFELVDDGLSASTNPATLSDDHKYNLFNSGWYVDKKDENTSGNPRDNVIDIYFNEFGTYPSNADSVALGMITNADGNLTFDPDYVKDAGLGNSLAPRGHFVYDIADFNRDARLSAPTVDGSPSTTLDLLGTLDLTGVPTYNPDDENDPNNPEIPWDPYPDFDVPPGYQIP